METEIVSYSKITETKLVLNKNCLFSDDPGTELSAFLHNCYKQLQLGYPKFFKMDNLCKLGIIATETLIRGCDEWDPAEGVNTALLFANHSSSIESDRAH